MAEGQGAEGRRRVEREEGKETEEGEEREKGEEGEERVEEARPSSEDHPGERQHRGRLWRPRSAAAKFPATSQPVMKVSVDAPAGVHCRKPTRNGFTRLYTSRQSRNVSRHKAEPRDKEKLTQQRAPCRHAIGGHDTLLHPRLTSPNTRGKTRRAWPAARQRMGRLMIGAALACSAGESEAGREKELARDWDKARQRERRRLRSQARQQTTDTRPGVCAGSFGWSAYFQRGARRAGVRTGPG